jgi:hypothetical protein
LILVDGDFFKDYPTQFVFQLSLPSYSSPSPVRNVSVIVLNGNIPPEKIPFLLQRAKIVIDLGMPGPERIASEGILFGVIPILSNRWNGISDVDFPIKYKIDLFKFSKEQILSDFLSPSASEKKTVLVNHQLTEMIGNILNNYNEEVNELFYPSSFSSVPATNSSPSSSKLLSHSTYFSYILSMNRRLANTANFFFSSSKLSITLIATSLKEEYLAIFQILSLFYFYPLCSIDLFVADSVWFMKHHYSFIDVMIQNGYLRYDLHDPTDFSAFEKETVSEPIISFLSIYSLFEFPSSSSASSSSSSSHKVKEKKLWKSISLFLPIGYLPRNSFSLFSIIQKAEATLSGKSKSIVLFEDRQEVFDMNGRRGNNDQRLLIVKKFPDGSNSDQQFFLFYDVIKTIHFSSEKSPLFSSSSFFPPQYDEDVDMGSLHFSCFISFYRLMCESKPVINDIYSSVDDGLESDRTLSKNGTEFDCQSSEVLDDIGGDGDDGHDMIYDILETASWLMMASFMKETIGIDTICGD